MVLQLKASLSTQVIKLSSNSNRNKVLHRSSMLYSQVIRKQQVILFSRKLEVTTKEESAGYAVKPKTLKFV
ncbi:hypothetical protein PanWU01x14_369410 [Parasponia andersonii]|uniref:Uncharacterized protein n=1 Tax=Parasponia andersonii TaxID=3476 RepID=A0A2P5A4P9_PARAD|nr:hypothetical protein PanWU01x14_369410 [Parasponia andersonii]